MDRRPFLARAALAGVPAGLAGVSTGLSGCLEGGDEEAPQDGTREGSSFGGHPATAGIDDQPYLGPAPGSATGTIVAFEDPSCTRCRVFERETVPKIRSELVEPGDATFVYRGYPVVYPWGEPATQALEAAHAREPDVHWALLDYYLGNQGRLSTENVLDRTREFLESETDLDGDAVAEDARNEAYGDRVQVDLDAGEDADVGNVTPTVFLFRDGEYRTRARGSVSFSVVESALDL